MWNLWTTLFGMKKGAQVAQEVTPILAAVAPQAAAVVDTVDAVADSVPAGSTPAQTAVTIVTELDPQLAARLQAAEKAILTAVNQKLDAAGVSPATEQELDALIAAQFTAAGVPAAG